MMYDFLEGRLNGRPWLMGGDFTLADCAAAPALLYARDQFPFAERPATAAYWDRLCARSSYARVLEEAEPCLRAPCERAA